MTIDQQHCDSSISRLLFSLLIVAVVSIAGATTSHASTSAGTVIKNQASASYKDTQGVRRIATSNVVETVIQQVPAIEIRASQTKPSVSGKQIYFAHTLVNTGNGPDTLDLSVNATGTGDFNFSDMAIYKDDNRDGEPDSFSNISTSQVLNAGESQSIVVGAIVPTGTSSGDTGQLRVQAQSRFDTSISVSNTDTAVVTDTAVIELTKRISQLTGPSPSSSYTVYLYYRNNSQSNATNIVLIDALPQGMSYVADSGRWSESGNTVLTDANSTDLQGGIVYCAYNNSCSGLPEAISDTDTISTNQVSAILDNVAAGDSGYIEFQVAIDSGLAASVLSNTAELQYTTSGMTIGPVTSNAVPFEIIRGASVVINGSSISSADGTGEPLEISDNIGGTNSNFPDCALPDSDPDGDGYGLENSVQCVVPVAQAGNAVFYKNTVWNKGNSIDSYDITTVGSSFPSGTVFRILQTDGQTPLIDTSNNGIVDTGPVAPGGSYEIILQVILPVGYTGNNSGANFNVSTVATSANDELATNSMVNILRNISGGSVDITNTSQLGDPQAVGTGAGPEATPVSSFDILPGEQVAVELYVNNISDSPMDFDLTASIHSDFSSIELPEYWNLEFVLSDGTKVSNTGVIPADTHLLVKAIFTVPVDSTPASFSIYFKAQNDGFSTSDVLHNEIVVAGRKAISLGNNQQGQAQAGSTYVYRHSIKNSGNTDLQNVALTLSDSRSDSGWSSTLFIDTDDNGQLSPSDQLVNSTDLSAGETKLLFVKVFSPASANEGQSNSTTLEVIWDSDSLVVTDTTRIGVGGISVHKEQALDVGCDGILDSTYSADAFAVEPGNNCVRYRLTAMNASAQSVLNVLVADATPMFTSYMGGASCSKPGCSITEPSFGNEGEIAASLSQLQAGDSVIVEFLVRIH